MDSVDLQGGEIQNCQGSRKHTPDFSEFRLNLIRLVLSLFCIHKLPLQVLMLVRSNHVLPSHHHTVILSHQLRNKKLVLYIIKKIIYFHQVTRKNKTRMMFNLMSMLNRWLTILPLMVKSQS